MNASRKVPGPRTSGLEPAASDAIVTASNLIGVNTVEMGCTLGNAYPAIVAMNMSPSTKLFGRLTG